MRQGDALRALESRASVQWGLFTAAQAKRDGVEGVQLLRLRRAGLLTGVGHGVYRLTDAPGTRHLGLKVAWLRLDPGADVERRRGDPRAGAVSHASACAVLGLGDPPGDRIELTLPVRRTTRSDGVVLHRLPLDAADITLVDGLPVTTAERTLVDLLRENADFAVLAAVLQDARERGLVETALLAARVVPFLPRFSVPAGGSGEDLLRALSVGAGRPVGTAVSGPAAVAEDGRAGKRATIWEVARLAGVSHQTVSRYFRDDGGMKASTRQKVDRAVAELGYRPDPVARTMRTSRSHRIAVVLPGLTNFVPGQILKGAAAVARDAGYTLDVVGLEGGERRRTEGVGALLAGRQADAVLSLASLAQSPESGTRPVIVLGEYDDALHARGETADGRPVEEILRHLAGLGHRRFLHVAGPREWNSARNRRTVYEEAVRLMGLESHGVLDGDWSVRSGYEAIGSLAHGSGVTAVLAANDHMALGVMRGLQDRGVAVPEQVSVFGWDDDEFGQYVTPALSTVHVDRETYGRQAMLALLARMRGERPAPIRVDGLFRLVPRGSSGPAPD
ncbi:substrate-binding domain-containing protein [Streptomyces sp. NPDC057363]|uniref:substrate-binding domain-containing protein n=1 Tax=Streptomyces sp. NPDC057363 TaxID=3346107 RepID=UPI003633A166